MTRTDVSTTRETEREGARGNRSAQHSPAARDQGIGPTEPSPAGPRPAGPAGTGPRRPARPARPRTPSTKPEQLALAFAQLYLEVESGNRPRPLLKPIMEPLLYVRLRDLWVRGGVAGRVVCLQGCEITSEIYEAVAVVRRGERYGALSLRLEHHTDGWFVTRVERPEDGPLPDPPYRMPRPCLDAFDLVSGSTPESSEGAAEWPALA